MGNFVFRNYSWIAVAVTATAIVVILVSRAPQREALIGSTIGGVLGFCYFAQKQKLEELRLFNELFRDFNRRYDRMNGRLEGICTGNSVHGTELKKALMDYFNLCAEEYLFFKEGYIHPQVWQSWCRGMLYYLRNSRIRQVWNEEMISDSYYGLTLLVIEQGAARH